MEQREAGVCTHGVVLLGVVDVEGVRRGDDEELVVLHGYGFWFAGCARGVDEAEYIGEVALGRDE